MQITLKETKKNTAYVDAVLTEQEIASEKEHAVDELISTVAVKGFRQGKAPRSIAADHIDPDKLSNHILSHVLNNVVTKVIKDNSFKLLGRPVLEKIDPNGKNGWTIKLSLPLFPEIKIDNYKTFFPKVSKSKIEKKTTKSQEDKIEKIYDTLLKNTKVEIPESVVEEEVNYSLEKLEKQAKTLNLTLESYLKAVKKTMEQIKEEYSKRAEESIKLDLILLEIARLEKINTPLDELKEIAKVGGVPDSQLGQLKSIVDRRKTIELLQKLC